MSDVTHKHGADFLARATRNDRVLDACERLLKRGLDRYIVTDLWFTNDPELAAIWDALTDEQIAALNKRRDARVTRPRTGRPDA